MDWWCWWSSPCGVKDMVSTSCKALSLRVEWATCSEQPVSRWAWASPPLPPRSPTWTGRSPAGSSSSASSINNQHQLEHWHQHQQSKTWSSAGGKPCDLLLEEVGRLRLNWHRWYLREMIIMITMMVIHNPNSFLWKLCAEDDDVDLQQTLACQRSVQFLLCSVHQYQPALLFTVHSICEKGQQSQDHIFQFLSELMSCHIPTNYCYIAIS